MSHTCSLTDAERQCIHYPGSFSDRIPWAGKAKRRTISYQYEDDDTRFNKRPAQAQWQRQVQDLGLANCSDQCPSGRPGLQFRRGHRWYATLGAGSQDALALTLIVTLNPNADPRTSPSPSPKPSLDTLTLALTLTLTLSQSPNFNPDPNSNPNPPDAVVAAGQRDEQVHDRRGDQDFDQVVVELLQHQLPERRPGVLRQLVAPVRLARLRTQHGTF